MAGGMSEMVKRELLAAIRDRYRASSKNDKTRILYELVAVARHRPRPASAAASAAPAAVRSALLFPFLVWLRVGSDGEVQAVAAWENASCESGQFSRAWWLTGTGPSAPLKSS